MLRNGGLLLEKRISYFDCKYSNPFHGFFAKELQEATKNYSHENRLSDFGSNYRWYKGCLEGRVIFVRKYNDFHYGRSFANPERVSNGIAVAAQVSGHKNALKLLGCCLEIEIPTPVFEFPMNGNLYYQLTSNPTCLPRGIRLQIANEIASVITYLHTEFPRPIIHRDIHPRNIDLDQDFSAKLSDFMLCMALPEDETQIKDNFTRTIRYICYMAPEVWLSEVYSEKSDVYGFGSLLLYLLKRMRSVNPKRIIKSFQHYTSSYIRNHTILAEAEAAGGVQYHHQFQALLHLGLKCCRDNAEERPIMLDVAKQLKQIQRGDFISNDANHNDASSSCNLGCPNDKSSRLI